MSQIPQFEIQRIYPEIVISIDEKLVANLEHVVSDHTKNGYREYRLRCFTMQDETTGEICDIRKDKFVNYYDPTDWLVLRYKEDDEIYFQEKVMRVARIATTEQGDEITLDLVPLVSHTGSRILTFNVNTEYLPTGEPAQIKHANYYGRGTASSPNYTIESNYTKNLHVIPNEDEDEYLAPVIDIETRRQRALGSLSTASEAIVS